MADMQTLMSVVQRLEGQGIDVMSLLQRAAMGSEARQPLALLATLSLWGARCHLINRLKDQGRVRL